MAKLPSLDMVITEWCWWNWLGPLQRNPDIKKDKRNLWGNLGCRPAVLLTSLTTLRFDAKYYAHNVLLQALRHAFFFITAEYKMYRKHGGKAPWGFLISVGVGGARRLQPLTLAFGCVCVVYCTFCSQRKHAGGKTNKAKRKGTGSERPFYKTRCCLCCLYSSETRIRCIIKQTEHATCYISS